MFFSGNFKDLKVKINEEPMPTDSQEGNSPTSLASAAGQSLSSQAPSPIMLSKTAPTPPTIDPSVTKHMQDNFSTFKMPLSPGGHTPSSQNTTPDSSVASRMHAYKVKKFKKSGSLRKIASLYQRQQNSSKEPQSSELVSKRSATPTVVAPNRSIHDSSPITTTNDVIDLSSHFTNNQTTTPSKSGGAFLNSMVEKKPSPSPSLSPLRNAPSPLHDSSKNTHAGIEPLKKSLDALASSIQKAKLPSLGTVSNSSPKHLSPSYPSKLHRSNKFDPHSKSYSSKSPTKSPFKSNIPSVSKSLEFSWQDQLKKARALAQQEPPSPVAVVSPLTPLNFTDTFPDQQQMTPSSLSSPPVLQQQGASFQYAQKSLWYVISTHTEVRDVLYQNYSKNPLLLLVRNKDATKPNSVIESIVNNKRKYTKAPPVYATYGNTLGRAKRFRKLKETMRDFLRKGPHRLCGEDPDDNPLLRKIYKKPFPKKQHLDHYYKHPQVVHYATELWFALQKHSQTGLLQFEEYCQFLRAVYALLIPDKCTVEREAIVQHDATEDTRNNADGLMLMEFRKCLVYLGLLWIDTDSPLELAAFIEFIHVHCSRVAQQSTQKFMRSVLPQPFKGTTQSEGDQAMSDSLFFSKRSTHTAKKTKSSRKKRTAESSTRSSLLSRLRSIHSSQSIEPVDRKYQPLVSSSRNAKYHTASVSLSEDFHGRVQSEIKQYHVDRFQKYMMAHEDTDDEFYFSEPQNIGSHSRLVQDPQSWMRSNWEMSLQTKGYTLNKADVKRNPLPKRGGSC